MRQRSCARRSGVTRAEAGGVAAVGNQLAQIGVAALLVLPALLLVAGRAPHVPTKGVLAMSAAGDGMRGRGVFPQMPLLDPTVPQGITPTVLASPTATATAKPSPTATATATPRPTATPTATAAPTATATAAPTATATSTTSTQGTGGQNNSGLIVALIIALGLVLLGLAALVIMLGTRRPPEPPPGGGYQEPLYTPPENYDPSRPSVYPGQGGGVSEVGPDDPTDPGLGAPPRT